MFIFGTRAPPPMSFRLPNTVSDGGGMRSTIIFSPALSTAKNFGKIRIGVQLPIKIRKARLEGTTTALILPNFSSNIIFI